MKTIAAATIAVMMFGCSRPETPAQPPAARGGKPMAQTGASGAVQPATPSPSPATGPTGVGDAMPAYAAKLLDGAAYDLASDKGKVVLVNVWATWCGPCRFEIPELQKLHDQYGARGFKVVGISVDEGDAAEVKQFAQAQKMSYPVVVDPEGKIANLLQTTVLPTSVLLDRNGKIVWRQVGAIPEHDPKLAAAIDAALAAKS